MALLEGDEPSSEMATVLGRYGKALWLAGDPHAGLKMIDEAIALSRRLALPEPVLLLGYRGGIRCILGDIGGLEDYLYALGAASTLGLSASPRRLIFNYADALLSYQGPAGRGRGPLGRHEVRPEAAPGRARRSVAVCPVEALGLMGEWDAEAVRRLTVNLIESLGLMGERDDARQGCGSSPPTSRRARPGRTW